MSTIQAMQKAMENGYKVKVVGVAQNARTKQPENVVGCVTKVGTTCFYVNNKRYRTYFDMTQAVISYGGVV